MKEKISSAFWYVMMCVVMFGAMLLFTVVLRGEVWFWSTLFGGN